MDKVYSDSLELHKKHHGKIEIANKVPLRDKADLSLAYTPGVAQASVEIGKDRNLAYEYTIKKNTVAVISDGSAILGLGNLGAHAAIPVMEGKAALFKEFANIDAFPICLDTQDTEEIIKTVKYLAPVFGGINLEDISAPRCFEIEERLVKELDILVMHDDQHGTATVVLAALINALKIKNIFKENAKIVMNGAGAAGIAVSKLLLKYGFKNLILCDSKGAIYDGRPDLNSAKERLAEITNLACKLGLDAPGCVSGGLISALEEADVFIGVSKAGVLTGEMIKKMNKEPIIFALANPIPEIMPDEAKEVGAAIIATGRSDFPNQINNVLAFPGIFRGALDNGVKKITEEMLIKAAENLAGCVVEPKAEMILPNIFDKNVVSAVARAIH